MGKNDVKPLSYFSDSQRSIGEKRYRVIEPNIIEEVSLPKISEKTGIPLKTLFCWKERYKEHGLLGLVRKQRLDSRNIKIEDSIRALVEHNRLSNHRICIAAIH